MHVTHSARAGACQGVLNKTQEVRDHPEAQLEMNDLADWLLVLLASLRPLCWLHLWLQAVSSGTATNDLRSHTNAQRPCICC